MLSMLHKLSACYTGVLTENLALVISPATVSAQLAGPQSGPYKIKAVAVGSAVRTEHLAGTMINAVQSKLKFLPAKPIITLCISTIQKKRPVGSAYIRILFSKSSARCWVLFGVVTMSKVWLCSFIPGT